MTTPENVEEELPFKIAVRDPDERWPDTQGEPIRMVDATPENVEGPKKPPVAAAWTPEQVRQAMEGLDRLKREPWPTRTPENVEES